MELIQGHGKATQPVEPLFYDFVGGGVAQAHVALRPKGMSGNNRNLFLLQQSGGELLGTKSQFRNFWEKIKGALRSKARDSIDGLQPFQELKPTTVEMDQHILYGLHCLIPLLNRSQSSELSEGGGVGSSLAL